MPRPKQGYFNAAGQPIPGTHDPIQRFMDQTALKFWAYKRGQQGLPLFDRAAIDIGSTVHGIAELDLRGRPDREIEAYANDRLVAPDHPARRGRRSPRSASGVSAVKPSGSKMPLTMGQTTPATKEKPAFDRGNAHPERRVESCQ